MPGMSYFTNMGAFIKAVIGFVPFAQAAATVNSAAIDRLPFRSAAVITTCGPTTGTPTSFTVTTKVQHSDTSGGSYTDYVPPALAAAPTSVVSAVNSLKKLSINLSGAKQFIKINSVVAFVGGTTPTVIVGTQIILGGTDTLPTTGDS